nr:MAG: hypothetical protein DIU80_04750 [Chloroflexota bacterium]
MNRLKETVRAISTVTEAQTEPAELWRRILRRDANARRVLLARIMPGGAQTGKVVALPARRTRSAA